MAAVPNAPGSLDFAAGSHFLPKGSVKKVPATESRGYDRAQSPSFSGFGGWHLFPPQGRSDGSSQGDFRFLPVAVACPTTRGVHSLHHTGGGRHED